MQIIIMFLSFANAPFAIIYTYTYIYTYEYIYTCIYINMPYISVTLTVFRIICKYTNINTIYKYKYIYSTYTID